MRRLLPYVVFLFVTGGLIAFVYKDRIFPPQAGAEGPQQGMTGAPGKAPQGSFRRGSQVVPVLAEKARTDNVPVYPTALELSRPSTQRLSEHRSAVG